ncbi:MAG: NAD-dependent epimerase/dehydratase family protein [Candidatus Aenigmarchaeota archaeon]|nr:NAD-dependent epimerase/dehydratase family protein [Candidatus Aenigmarchaeota archaeon]MDW8160069.1 NAD-dependent epimerase/dehydratase family protein [Candidatus Aenigmarchaeota archaeon]
MKVLVTGAAGFIGSHLVEEFKKKGFDVYGLDNFHTGNMKNIEMFDIEIIKGDAKKISEIDKKFDAILHNGIYSSSPMYKENPHLVGRVVEDMICVLEYAKKNKSRVVLASTSSLYNSNEIPWKENMPIKVTDFYTEARLACERLCELYSKLFGVECISLRYFSVFGEREEFKGRYANVLTQMIWSALRGEEFVIYGDGEQSRDLIYVKDVIEANLKAVDFKDFSSTKFEIFNVGSGKTFSFNQMAEIVNRKIPLKVKYTENPIKNYVGKTMADTEKAEKLLGFGAKFQVSDTLGKLIKYYSDLFEVKI